MPDAYDSGRRVPFSPMLGENKERWKILCEQASIEQDPVKLLKLIKEIDDLLLKKEERLLRARLPPTPDTP
jgi:hypothetical protein